MAYDIYEGFLLTALPHTANISYRLRGEVPDFNTQTEKFINNDQANEMFTDQYQDRYIVPDKV